MIKTLSKENIEESRKEFNAIDMNELKSIVRDFIYEYLKVDILNQLDIEYLVDSVPADIYENRCQLTRGYYSRWKQSITINTYTSLLPNPKLEVMLVLTHELIHAIQIELGIGKYGCINYLELNNKEKENNVDYCDLTTEIDARIGELNFLTYLKNTGIVIPEDFYLDKIKQIFKYKDIKRLENYLFKINDSFVTFIYNCFKFQ